MKYKFIEDLTSDVMFEAYGKDLKELFQNSALALSEVICKNVKPKVKVNVKIKSDDLEDLMVDWLQKIISLVDIKDMFFSKFVVKKIDEKSLSAEIYGEKISPEKGETVVKAVTNYKFKLEKKKNYLVRVSLDI